MSKRSDSQKEKATDRYQVCHHVLEGRINTPKRCMLNHECFHCAYDQWLDAIDLEKMHSCLITQVSKCHLAQAA